MSLPDTERLAVVEDAQQRVRELEAVRAALLPDADDPVVLSELTTIESQLSAAVAVAGSASATGAER